MKTMGTEKMKAWYSLSSAKLEPGEAEEQQRAGGSELEPVSVSEDIFRRPDSHLAKGSRSLPRTPPPNARKKDFKRSGRTEDSDTRTPSNQTTEKEQEKWSDRRDLLFKKLQEHDNANPPR